MKKLYFTIIISHFFFLTSLGQNIGINTDGSVGATLLHTKNTAAATDNILRIENTIAAQKSGINLLTATVNANWLFYVPASSTDLRLQLYTGTDAVTFLNNGNVGIGYSSPSYRLCIKKDVLSDAQVQINSNAVSLYLGAQWIGNIPTVLFVVLD